MQLLVSLIASLNLKLDPIWCYSSLVLNRVERGCREVDRAAIDVRDCKAYTTNKVDRGGGIQRGLRRAD
eukprot:IDg3984t1